MSEPHAFNSQPLDPYDFAPPGVRRARPTPAARNRDDGAVRRVVPEAILAVRPPQLRTRVISANKVLALMGLEFNMASSGFNFNEE
eukprot:3793447-Pyramimonas_sp.AAC.1